MRNLFGRGAPGGTTSTTGRSDVTPPIEPQAPVEQPPAAPAEATRPAAAGEATGAAALDLKQDDSVRGPHIPSQRSSSDTAPVGEPATAPDPAVETAPDPAAPDPADPDSADADSNDADSAGPASAGTDLGPDPVAPVAPVAVRRRRPLWAKVLVSVGAVLVLLSAGTVAGLHYLAGRYDKSVHKAILIDPGARVQPTDDGGLTAPFIGPAVTGPLNFLLLGSDARDTDPSNGQRSDTIILVHIPASLDRAYLISIPRDLRVRIPADPATGFEGGRQKINAAFNYGGGGVGGFQLLSKTLNQLINIKFDGAAIINFDGFQNAVKLLGGVNLCVDEKTKSIHTKVTYQVGCQHMAPWQALDYVRQRELLPEGDYDRQRHQQQFLKAIFQEAIDQGIATNPIKLDQLIRAVGSALTVDTNGVPLANLVFGLKGINAGSLVGIKLPSEPQMIGGVSYVVAEDEATSLYQAIASDTLEDWVAANPSWVNAI
ncbi:LCP family protein [Rugosimonospora africana]|uniref:Cell envelope-related transcriptional attenuator domain-containing protein n=1 Tax=Rugosimonospora africana TaxID=556532 RepID=A0A8J3QLE8_9ACTN|nr:LCP family protein [Rugosimonospora africana]GIH13113.1 hypothetical protein Raf01_12850 [Rugosimonospora africana]